MTNQHIDIEQVNDLFREAAMPRRDGPRREFSRRPIDYVEFRRTVLARGGVRRVLELHGYRPRTIRGDQARGGCPLHGSKSLRSRSFSINLARGAWQCFKCGEKGGIFDLHAKLTNLTVYDACCDLADRLGIDIPYLPSVDERKRTRSKTSKDK